MQIMRRIRGVVVGAEVGVIGSTVVTDVCATGVGAAAVATGAGNCGSGICIKPIIGPGNCGSAAAASGVELIFAS